MIIIMDNVCTDIFIKEHHDIKLSSAMVTKNKVRVTLKIMFKMIFMKK